MPDLPHLYTTREVADALHLNVQTVQAYVRAGKFPNTRTVGTGPSAVMRAEPTTRGRSGRSTMPATSSEPGER